MNEELAKRLDEHIIRNQQEHHKIFLALNDINNKLDRHLEKLEASEKQCKKHIEESVPLRDQIRDNTRFRDGATKALWTIYISIIGILSKIFLFK